MIVQKALKSPIGDCAASGFTLVELMVVLALIALLISAVPSIFSAGRPGVEAKSVAYALKSDLEAARVLAILEDRKRTVILHFADKYYALPPDGRRRYLPNGVKWELYGTSNIPGMGSLELSFFPDGSSSGGKIDISSKGQHHKVSDHGLTGRITIDD